MVLFKFLLSLILYTTVAVSLEAASLWDQLNPIQKRTWLKLLHYEGASTLIDENTFFVDPLGDKSPENELKTFLTLYHSNSKKLMEDLNSLFIAPTLQE